ncbi:MAG: tetratricopeptide repeat protein [Candidatus Omnitrophica bacterium]|nr:tetratricopeptide repeat protein [Candidatus Omnitrophota bacterium]
MREIKNSKTVILILGLILCCGSRDASAGGGLSGKISEGNKLFAKKEYDKALTKYNDAGIDFPTSPEMFFNMGNVFFRQAKYKEAVDSYRKSMEKGDRAIEAKAMYNIGNALFNQGELREALEYYKQALARDPNDQDAKYNVEYTERMIKEMLSKAKDTMKKAAEENKEREDRQKEDGQKQQASQSDGAKQNNEDEKQGEDKTEAASVKDLNKEDVKEGEEKESGADKEKAMLAADKEDKKEGDEGEQSSSSEKGEPKDRDKDKQSEAGGKDKKDTSKEEAEKFLTVFDRDHKNNQLTSQQVSKKGRGYYVEKDW